MKGVKSKKKPYVSFRDLGDRKQERGSSAIIEESPDNVRESSFLTTETKSKDFASIDMPSSRTPTPKKPNLLGSTSTSEVLVGSSSNSKSSSQSLPPKPKSKPKIPSGILNMEEVAILALGGLQPPTSERSPLLSSSSLMAPIDRATSMPAGPFQPSNSNSTDDHQTALQSSICTNLPKDFYFLFCALLIWEQSLFDSDLVRDFLQGVGEQQPIYRSRSVPVIYADGNIRDNHIRVLRVVPKRLMTERNSGLSCASSIHSDEDDQEDITEDEAVCRICFEELGDELESFKLECKCKGDMALVHKECCQRWFNIKGNKTCEICKNEVRNITVKVRRTPAINLRSLHHLQQPPMIYADRLWHEFPILVVASIVGYFMSFQLIQKTTRGGGIGKQLSIPASCLLGLITSLAATAFAKRKHVWMYAIVQFLIFTLFALVFYGLLYLEPLTALIVATVASMLISRGAGPVYRAVKKWRASRQNQDNINPQNGAPPVELQPTHEPC